jgi:hypothetical protein
MRASECIAPRPIASTKRHVAFDARHCSYSTRHGECRLLVQFARETSGRVAQTAPPRLRREPRAEAFLDPAQVHERLIGAQLLHECIGLRRSGLEQGIGREHSKAGGGPTDPKGSAGNLQDVSDPLQRCVLRAPTGSCDATLPHLSRHSPSRSTTPVFVIVQAGRAARDAIPINSGAADPPEIVLERL